MRLIDADAFIERIEDDIKAIEDKEPVIAMGAIGVLNTIKKAPPVEPKRLPQPHKCVVYRDGSLCRHPIEACSECPKHEGMRAVLAERPKGEWVGEGDGYADGGIVYDTWYCSKCDHCEEGEELALPNFCPNCGADMRGEEE